MSNLRQHIEQQRIAYQAIRYPGDLSGDLMARQRFHMGPFWKIAIPLATAASVAILVGVIAHHSVSRRAPVAMNPPDQTDTALVDVIPIAPALPMTPTPAALPSTLSLPTDLPTSPGTVLTSFPSVPSMPSWSDTSSSTFKESI